MANNYFTILSQVVSSIQSITTPPNVVLRKKLLWLEGDSINSIPLVIVAPGEKGEYLRTQTMKQGAFWNYPVDVVLISQGDRIVQTNLSAYFSLRENIRNQLFQPFLNGAAVVWDTNINPRPAAQLQAFLGTQFDITGWTVEYSTAETRIS